MKPPSFAIQVCSGRMGERLVRCAAERPTRRQASGNQPLAV